MLNRQSDQRKAMLRNLVTSFLENGRIETTLTRAERNSEHGRENDYSWLRQIHYISRRQALEFITKEDVVTKVFSEIAPKYADRNGGYTRIYQTGPRRGDSAPMAILELVD